MVTGGKKKGRKAERETRREGGRKGTGLVYKGAHALVTALSFSCPVRWILKEFPFVLNK